MTAIGLWIECEFYKGLRPSEKYFSDGLKCKKNQFAKSDTGIRQIPDMLQNAGFDNPAYGLS